MLIYIIEFWGVGTEVYFILLFLGVPVYFFWKRIFKKTKRYKRLAIWATTIVSTPLIYMLTVLAILFVMEHYPNKEFNRDEWFRQKDERYEYSENLIDSRILIGKLKKDVLYLLGNEGINTRDDIWYYELGYRPEIGNIDPDTLEIDFKNGKVFHVEQHKH